MKTNPENLKIASILFLSWMKAMRLITFRHPKRYLEKLLQKQAPKDIILTEKQWIIVKKVVKGTHRISPLFRKERRCLIESIVVYKSLGKFGIGAQFKIGALSEEKKISTHAWIEIEGKTVIGGPVKNYHQLIRTH